jgi:DNA-directed RNA polymerase specialized sigma subunit
MKSRKEKDLELWEKWSKTRDPKDLGDLLNNMNPLIQSTINPLRGSISDNVLETEAKINAVKAFNTYDPSKNTQLSTHVTNQLQKTNRVVYDNMELLKVPEQRRIKFKNYEAVYSHLEHKNNRPPTINELARELGWSTAEVVRHQRESWKELSASNPNVSDAGFHDDANSTLISYVYNDLNPRNQKVFEMTTGYGSGKEYSNSEIMKKLKLSQGQLSYAKTDIKNQLKRAMGELGD